MKKSQIFATFSQFMKKLVIIIASLVIIFPFLFKWDNFSLDYWGKQVEKFFTSSGEKLITSGQEEFNRVLNQKMDFESKSEPEPEVAEEELEISPDETGATADSESEITKANASVYIEVPFTVQAPLGNWSDERQQDACEEAGVIMAMAWIRDRQELDPLVTQNEIIALADWQQEKYGEHRDLHIDEVRTRLFGKYFDYHQVETKEISNKEEIITTLNEGQIILAPANGRALKNPHFSPPGPERHLVVIIGYDLDSDEFITNDSGTRYGASYRYQADLLFAAITTYPTGFHEKITDSRKFVLLVSK